MSLKKVGKWLSTGFLGLMFMAVVFIIYVVFQSKGDIEKAPSILGYKPLTILSNSMQPVFEAGDVILIKSAESPKLNDVITYKHPDGIVVTHRVIKVTEKDGQPAFLTKGDNNNVDDKVVIPKEDVLGVQAVIIPNAGYIAKFASGPYGFFLLIVTPLLLLAIIEIFQRLGLLGTKREKQIQG